MDTNLKKLLDRGPKSVNLGLKDFTKSLRDQGAQVVQVDWRPTAGGDPEMIDLLSKIL